MSNYYLASSDELTQIAQAIREKGETANEMTFPEGYLTAIQNIETTHILGEKWTSTEPLYISKVVYGNGVWCCSAYSGSSTLFYSLDGKIWNSTGINITIHDLCFQGRFWFAASPNGTLYSRNGWEWSLSQILPEYPNIVELTAAEGIMMGVDLEARKLYKWDNSWDSGMLINNYGNPHGSNVNIDYSNGFWFMGFQGAIYTSSDKGRNWTVGGTQWGNGVGFYHFAAYNEVLVGTASGAMVYSTDYGANWFVASSFSNPSIANSKYGQVIAGNGIFVAAGNIDNATSSNGIGLIYSNNGFDWHEATINGQPIYDHLTSLTFVNNKWYAHSKLPVDGQNSNNGVQTYLSEDGIHWYKGAILKGYLNAGYASNGEILVTGGASGLYYSE